MSETKALIFVFIGTAVLTCAVGVALALTDASGTVYGLAIVFLAALGGFCSSRVVMRYDSLEERHRREESLLR